MLAVLLLSTATGLGPGVPDSDVQAIAARLRPTAEELTFREIGWRSAFFDAVVEAQSAKKPVLLWAMNGNPLGCT